MTSRPKPALDDQLNQPSEAAQRSKSPLATKATLDCLDLNQSQLREVEKAMTEADRGGFATDDLVREVFSKWGADASSSAYQGTARY